MSTEVCGKFMDIISSDFDNIKNAFIKRCINNELDFDEDVFMDALLNCERVLNGKLMTKSECIKYYWVAYSNKLRTFKSKQDIFVSYDDIMNYNIQSSLNSSYNSSVDYKYNEIVKMAYEKFDKIYVDAWLAHICEGKTYKELQELGYNFKFNDIFKRITKFIKKEYNLGIH